MTERKTYVPVIVARAVGPLKRKMDCAMCGHVLQQGSVPSAMVAVQAMDMAAVFCCVPGDQRDDP